MKSSVNPDSVFFLFVIQVHSLQRWLSRMNTLTVTHLPALKLLCFRDLGWFRFQLFEPLILFPIFKLPLFFKKIFFLWSNSFFFFSFIFIRLRLITLQYCSGFCPLLCSKVTSKEWEHKTLGSHPQP